MVKFTLSLFITIIVKRTILENVVQRGMWSVFHRSTPGWRIKYPVACHFTPTNRFNVCNSSENWVRHSHGTAIAGPTSRSEYACVKIIQYACSHDLLPLVFVVIIIACLCFFWMGRGVPSHQAPLAQWYHSDRYGLQGTRPFGTSCGWFESVKSSLQTQQFQALVFVHATNYNASYFEFT